MTWIVLTILAVLIVGTAGAVGVSATDGTTKMYAWGTFLGVGVIWLIITGVFSIERVGARQVGIVKSFSGTLVGTRGQGPSVIAPWDSVIKTDVGVQRENFTLDQNNSAVSSDQQPIYATLALNYSIGAPNILGLYKTVGPNWKAILLDSRVLQDFKEVTSTFTAEQITTNREALRTRTKARLAVELAKYDITVVDFFVTNLDYTDTYKQAINSKNIQVQQALQAQAKVAQATAEANQAIATARGRAQSNLVEARAEATALDVKGAALRKNPEILQLEAIDKLNPHASVIICTGTGQGNCPSFLPAPVAGK